MKYQDEFFNLRNQLRENLQARAKAAIDGARSRLSEAEQRVQRLKQSLAVVTEAGQELGKITGRHARHFARQNAPLLAAVGKDLSVLARSTLAKVQHGSPAGRRARKTPATRRARKAA